MAKRFQIGKGKIAGNLKKASNTGLFADVGNKLFVFFRNLITPCRSYSVYKTYNQSPIFCLDTWVYSEGYFQELKEEGLKTADFWTLFFVTLFFFKLNIFSTGE